MEMTGGTYAEGGLGTYDIYIGLVPKIDKVTVKQRSICAICTIGNGGGPNMIKILTSYTSGPKAKQEIGAALPL